MSRQARLEVPVPRLAVRGYIELGAALGLSEDGARAIVHEIPH
jgi:hypothetical protein